MSPSISHTFTMRLNYANGIGMFARIAQTIGDQGGDLGGIISCRLTIKP